MSTRLGYTPKSRKSQVHAQLRKELIEVGHSSEEAMEIAQEMLNEEYGPSVWGGDDESCLMEVYRGRRPMVIEESALR